MNITVTATAPNATTTGRRSNRSQTSNWTIHHVNIPQSGVLGKGK
ncbi:MAG: hypothetical protein UZ07_CHB004001134 [Chlorobi bacterium OLB7]|nr:MAG: hypothetical protein UZ07_CHB004001134 [Chlorobi bacterium OLB7]